MVVAKKDRSTYGPISYGSEAYDYKKYEEPRKKHKNLANHKNKTNRKRQLKLISMVALMLCTGMLIVGRYALIVNLNKQYLDLKNALAENEKANETLNIKLMKYYDIKEIEKNATTKLNMVRPDSSNIVYINIDNIDKKKNVANVDKSSKPEVGFIGKIAKFFN